MALAAAAPLRFYYAPRTVKKRERFPPRPPHHLRHSPPPLALCSLRRSGSPSPTHRRPVTCGTINGGGREKHGRACRPCDPLCSSARVSIWRLFGCFFVFFLPHLHSCDIILRESPCFVGRSENRMSQPSGPEKQRLCRMRAFS